MLCNRPFIIVHEGNGITQIFADGKVYGDGITDILFEHKRDKSPYPGNPGKPDVSIHITSDDVNIAGNDDENVIFAFKKMVDKIIENAPHK